jgi:proteic killer suppression protein
MHHLAVAADLAIVASSWAFGGSTSNANIRSIWINIGCNSTVITLDVNILRRYHCYMILSFRCKETEKLAGGRYSRKLPADIQRIAARKLKMLNDAVELNDLRVPPANRLEALKGRRKGQHSIRINDQWRLCFRWQKGNASDVEIVDYH